MKRLPAKRFLYATVGSFLAIMAVGFAPPAAAQPSSTPQSAPEIDANAIGGVVTSRFGPEAGVWVVAETKELGTRFAKMVVTDDFGRFVLPDLPKAHYQIWVRGYGLVDSPKTAGEPGQRMYLTAEVAPNPRPLPNIIRPYTGSRCCASPTRADFQVQGRTGTGSGRVQDAGPVA